MEKEKSYSEKAVVTNANEHGRCQFEIMVDEKECKNVFDLGN